MTAVWLWSAGTAEGVAGDRATACRNAASCLSRPGDTAVVEQARLVLLTGGGNPLDAGYEKLTGTPQLTARRRPGGRLTWQEATWPAGNDMTEQNGQ